MEKFGTALGLSSETISTIISSALTIVSIFVVVSVGYYIYHFFFEKKNNNK